MNRITLKVGRFYDSSTGKLYFCLGDLSVLGCTGLPMVVVNLTTGDISRCLREAGWAVKEYKYNPRQKPEVVDITSRGTVFSDGVTAGKYVRLTDAVKVALEKEGIEYD